MVTDSFITIFKYTLIKNQNLDLKEIIVCEVLVLMLKSNRITTFQAKIKTCLFDGVLDGQKETWKDHFMHKLFDRFYHIFIY